MKDTKTRDNKYSNKSKKYKGNDRNNKGYDKKKACDKGKKDDVSVDVQGYANDVSWYSKNAQLLMDASNIPFHYPAGSPITMQFPGLENENVKRYFMPGITRISWIPSIGVSPDNNSAVNIAARNIYAFIRQANSGAKNYDSPDLMLYLLAMDSLHAYYSWMIRLYGTFQYTLVNQRYTPKYMVEVQGGFYDDLIGKLAQFRYYINSFAVRLSALAVPNDMYYFTRHRWMSNNIYMDQPSTKAQFYVYVPEGLYQYHINDETKAGELVFKRMMFKMSLDSIIEYGEQLLNAVLGDEDINIMSGDILKAYGNNLVVLPRIDDSYFVSPVYSAEVLSQIHNATSIPTELKPKIVGDNSHWNITQNPTSGAIIFNPLTSIRDDQTEEDIGHVTHTPTFALLDSNFEIPTASDVMVSTRLTTLCKVKTDSSNIHLSLSSAGSEIVTGIHYYVIDDNSLSDGPNDAIVPVSWPTFEFNDYTEGATLNKVAAPMYITSAYDAGAFDGMPLRMSLNKYNPSENRGVYYKVSIMGQRNNLTLVDQEDLTRMHDCALLSEFNVPAFGPGK